MFDIGWTELLVLAVVAVVVVGPKDLPKLMRSLGKWASRARSMADQFKRSFDDMARQSELEELRAEVMKIHSEKSLAQIHRETEIMLGNIAPDPIEEDIVSQQSLIRNVETDPHLATNGNGAAANVTATSSAAQAELPGLDVPQAPPARAEP